MKDGFESLGRVRLQGLLLLAVAFAAGIAGGMALERVRAVRSWRAAERPFVEAGPRGMRPLALFEQLDLTDEQRARIRAIVEASRPAIDSVFRLTAPQIAAIHDSVRAEIRTLLTPEQQERFDELEPGWGPRGGPGEWGPPGPGGRGGQGPRRRAGGAPPDSP